MNFFKKNLTYNQIKFPLTYYQKVECNSDCEKLGEDVKLFASSGALKNWLDNNFTVTYHLIISPPEK